jgi:hypothetical protein
MGLAELRSQLENDGFDRHLYSFDRLSPPMEGYILEKLGDRWIIFYTERGLFRDIANFLYEGDACDFFLHTMRRAFCSPSNGTPQKNHSRLKGN